MSGEQRMTESEEAQDKEHKHSGAVERVRVRYFVVAWLVLIIWLPGAKSVVIAMGYDTPWYWLDIGLIYYLQGLVLVGLALTLLVWRFPVSEMLGSRPGLPAMKFGLPLTAFLFFTAVPALYLVFFPLSYVAPYFVYVWVIDLPGTIYFDNGVFPFLPNLLNIVSLCVIAPILEEVAFRGVILHRWVHKFGMWKAIVGSSLLFGIVHPDVLGAFLFGVGMCVLYLRFQSLYVPIICHGLYNLVVWLVELGYFYHDGPYAEHTLSGFREDWPLAVVFGVVALMWAIVYLRRKGFPTGLRLPSLSR